MMNYTQTTTLFAAMDDLETYSKMHQRELSKEDCDWDAVSRYSDYIKVARKNIFNMIQEKSNENT